MELISLKDISSDNKITLLSELGYFSDGKFVLDGKGEQVIDKYIGEPVTLSNMVILPGSTVILDDNHLSIASYMAEYGNIL